MIMPAVIDESARTPKRDETASSKSLLACPFCGDEEPRETPDQLKDPYTWCTNTACMACDVEIHLDAWQKRAS